MNAAFLLVTTAWFAGADPAPATTTMPVAPLSGAVASAPLGGAGVGGVGGCCGGAGGAGYMDGCCGGYEGCCCKVGLLQRLKARKCCCNTCCTCATTCCNTCGNSCCGGGFGGGYASGGCGCGNVGGGCGSCCEPCCCKPSLLQRLKARKCCCCGGGYEGCCGGGYGAGVGGVGGMGGVGGVGGFGAPPAVMPNAEPIKVLPKDSTPKKSGTVQSHNQGLTPASSSNVLEANPF